MIAAVATIRSRLKIIPEERYISVCLIRVRSIRRKLEFAAAVNWTIMQRKFIGEARNGRKTMDDITYMDCWLYIAPLIPIKADTYSKDVYVMTFRALKEAEERRVKENDVE